MAERETIKMHRLAEFPTPKTLRLVTAVAFLFTAAIFFVFRVHDRPLRPYDIVAFELAWTPQKAETIMGVWGEAGSQTARESLLIDFGYLPAYSFFFAGLTLMAARAVTARLQTLGFVLTFVPFVSAVFDAVENLTLLSVLQTPGNPSALALILAGVCATLKFSLLVICLLYMLGVVIYRRVRAAG
jgi:hypothetical protein